MKEKGKVIRGYLGVWLQPLTEDLAKSFGLKDTKGALISDVIKNTPAEKAGFKEGDVIVEFDGKKVKDVRDLQMKVANTPVGKKVAVKVWRDGKFITLRVKVGEMPEESKIAEKKEVGFWMGMKVEGITDEMINRYGLENKEGVIVVEVKPGSPADEAGIIPGSVIKKIDRYSIKNYSDFLRVKKKVSSKNYISIYIIVNGQGRFVVLKKGE